jgi:hypothetical protein
MAKKTALQEFIEAISNSGIVIINQTLIDNCLEMERQQIEDTFTSRCMNFVCSETKNNCSCGIDYYNKTFKSEKK